MRQEPIVYVNGNPVCARPPNKIGEYAELGNVTRASVKSDEEEFIKVIEGRAKADGKLKVVDVGKKESELEVKELITLSKVMEGLKEKYPGLTHNRIPVCNSAVPLLAASPLVFSVNSSSLPATKVSLKPFPESTLKFFAWTNIPWTPKRILSSVENSKL